MNLERTGNGKCYKIVINTQTHCTQWKRNWLDKKKKLCIIWIWIWIFTQSLTLDCSTGIVYCIPYRDRPTEYLLLFISFICYAISMYDLRSSDNEWNIFFLIFHFISFSMYDFHDTRCVYSVHIVISSKRMINCLWCTFSFDSFMPQISLHFFFFLLSWRDGIFSVEILCMQTRSKSRICLCVIRQATKSVDLRAILSSLKTLWTRGKKKNSQHHHEHWSWWRHLMK